MPDLQFVIVNENLFTGEKKRQRVKVAKKLLQMFLTYDKKQVANVVTCDEKYFHYFEPVRKVTNKILATKQSANPNSCQAVFECKEGSVCNFLLW